MRFTYYTDYALRVLMYLGARPGELAKTRDIAESFGVSEAHLVKVVHHLGTIDVVETVRGRGGGVRLASPPSAINIGDVVRQTEADQALVECFDPQTNTCPLTSACVLQGALDEALEAFFDTLDSYTLADLVRPRRALRDLLGLGAAARPRS